MPGRKHTHKYYKMQLNDTKVWACALSGCSHYMPKHLEALMTNRPSICWSCGEEFILEPLLMKSDKPFCSSCNPDVSGLLELVESKLS